MVYKRKHLEEYDLDDENKPGRRRLYGKYDVMPEIGKPVIIQDKESNTKQIITLTSDGHIRCCGTIRKVGKDMYFWQGLGGQEGRRKTEWEAFMALGYKYNHDGELEVIRGRAAIVEPRKSQEPEAAMVEPSTGKSCAIDKQLNILRPGCKVKFVGCKAEHVDKDLKGHVGVVLEVNTSPTKNCLVFINETTEDWYSSRVLELVK